MDSTMIAVDALLGSLAGLLGWLFTKGIVRTSPRAAQYTAVVLATLTMGLSQGLVAPRVKAWRDDLAMVAVGFQIYGNTVAARAFADGMKPLFADPKLRERIAKGPHGDKDFTGRFSNANQAAFAELTAEGLPRLPGDEMEALFAVKRRLAERSPALCAAFWKGGAKADALVAGLRGLPPEQQKVWIAATARAALLALRAETPVAPIPRAGAEQAAAALVAALGPAPRAAYLAASGAGADVTDAAGCAAFRAFADGLPALAPELRQRMILMSSGAAVAER
jgi:hypothetical protein